MFFLDENVTTKNYERFMEFVDQDSRSEQLRQFYAPGGILHDELISAPASGKLHYHNCFPGGYLDHVLRVIDNAMKLAPLYKDMGGTIDFTKQELIFSAMNHDLHKLGTEEGPYYVDTEEWQKKRGEYYTQNKSIQYFSGADRGLMMLQKHGIVLTEKEWLAIKLADGMWDEGNHAYLQNFLPWPMKTSLHNIIHWADSMAAKAEEGMARIF